jgi:hypothetical protein
LKFDLKEAQWLPSFFGSTMKKIILLLLLTTVLLFTSQIEQSCLSMRVSWTLSKAIPYCLLVILGILLAIAFNKTKIKNKFLKFSLTFLLLAAPFGIGFIIHPIYEGDFSLIGSEMNETSLLKEFKNTDLAVITIPGCPYCMASIEKLKLIKKRNPSIRIHFIVCSDNKNDLKPYISEAKNELSVMLSSNIDFTAKIADHRFPTFIQIKGNRAVYKWSNDQFGVRAIDQLESELN